MPKSGTLPDLWTGDLALGGESSIGRGRLKGIKANLKQMYDGEVIKWEISQLDQSLKLTANPEQEDVWCSLESFVEALHEHLERR